MNSSHDNATLVQATEHVAADLDAILTVLDENHAAQATNAALTGARMRMIKGVGTGFTDVDPATASAIYEEVVGANPAPCRETTDREPTGETATIYLTSYTLNNQERWAVVYSDAAEVTIDDSDSYDDAAAHYEATVTELTNAALTIPTGGECVWDHTDVPGLPQGSFRKFVGHHHN